MLTAIASLVPQLLADSSDATAGGLFAGGVGILFLIVGLIASLFWLWMLIDCIVSPMQGTEKILWFLVIFFLHLLGALIYFFMKRPGHRGITRASTV